MYNTRHYNYLVMSLYFNFRRNIQLLSLSYIHWVTGIVSQFLWSFHVTHHTVNESILTSISCVYYAAQGCHDDRKARSCCFCDRPCLRVYRAYVPVCCLRTDMWFLIIRAFTVESKYELSSSMPDMCCIWDDLLSKRWKVAKRQAKRHCQTTFEMMSI